MVRTPGGRLLAGCSLIDIWWARRFKTIAEETLFIRQETEGNPTADLIELTLGQVYELIEALNHAVEKP